MPNVREVVAAVGGDLLDLVTGDGTAEVRDVRLLTAAAASGDEPGGGATAGVGDLVVCVCAERDVAVLPGLVAGWPHVSAVVLDAAQAADPAVLDAARRRGTTVLAAAPGTAWAQLVWLLVGLLDAAPSGAPGASRASGFGGLFALADALAGVLGGPVTVEDADSRVLAHSTGQHPADPARLSTIVGRRVPAELTEHFRSTGVLRALQRSDEPVVVPSWGPGISPRLVIPVRAGRELLGSIWAAVDRPVPPGDVEGLRRVVSQLAVQLLQLRAQEDLVARLETERLHAALTGEAPTGWSPAGTPPWRVVCLAERRSPASATEPPSARTESWRSVLRWAGWRAPLLARVDDLVVAVVDSASAAHPGSWDWLRDNVGAGLAAASRPVGAAASLPAARVEAAETMRLLQSGAVSQPAPGTGRGHGTAHRSAAGSADGRVHAVTADDAWAALVVHRAAAAVRGGDLPGPVQQLVEHDRRAGTAYARTLLADLTHPGNARAAAASLHVHPNTFRYRMRRAAEVADLDRTDPQVRLAALLLLTAEADSLPG